MKFVAGILCVIVIWLSVLPCCALDHAAQNAPAKTIITDSHANDNCCANCSPFYSCGSCTGFTLPGITFINLYVPLLTTTPVYDDYVQPSLKEIIQTIWQPPKLS